MNRWLVVWVEFITNLRIRHVTEVENLKNLAFLLDKAIRFNVNYMIYQLTSWIKLMILKLDFLQLFISLIEFGKTSQSLISLFYNFKYSNFNFVNKNTFLF